MRFTNAHEEYWRLCYSHFLYPAFLLSRKLIKTAKSKHFTRLKEILSDSPQLSGLVESLTPAMFYFGMIAEINASDKKLQPDIELKYDNAGWEAMFDRHAEEVSTIAEILYVSEIDGSTRGRDFWQHELGDQSRLVRFLKSMDEHSTETATKLRPFLEKFSGKTIVDVGCGAGTYAKQFLDSKSASRAFLLDKTEVVEKLPLFLSLNQLNKSVLIPGDVFEVQIPTEQDIYLVSHLLQDFKKEDRITFLTKLVSVLGTSSEVWVHGHHWTPSDVNETVSSFSYYLQVRLGGSLQGKVSLESEFASLGLELTNTITTSLTESVLVFRRIA